MEVIHSLTEAIQFRNLLVDYADKHGYFVIFKNSTQCGTSRMAWKRFNEDWKSNVPVYMVQVIENRGLSDEIANITGISHESPQVLLFKGATVIHHESHSAIDAGILNRLIDSEPG